MSRPLTGKCRGVPCLAVARLRTRAARLPAAKSIAVGTCALVAVTTFACAGTAEWRGTIEERDGVVYVSNPAEGLWDDEGRVYTVVMDPYPHIRRYRMIIDR